MWHPEKEKKRWSAACVQLPQLSWPPFFLDTAYPGLLLFHCLTRSRQCYFRRFLPIFVLIEVNHDFSILFTPLVIHFLWEWHQSRRPEPPGSSSGPCSHIKPTPTVLSPYQESFHTSVHWEINKKTHWRIRIGFSRKHARTHTHELRCIKRLTVCEHYFLHVMHWVLRDPTTLHLQDLAESSGHTLLSELRLISLSSSHPHFPPSSWLKRFCKWILTMATAIALTRVRLSLRPAKSRSSLYSTNKNKNTKIHVLVMNVASRARNQVA